VQSGTLAHSDHGDGHDVDDALRKIEPNMRFDEAGLLSAFDANRNLIYAAGQGSPGRTTGASLSEVLFSEVSKAANPDAGQASQVPRA
jgi:hypothetical protein